MPFFKLRDTVDALETLLDKERRAILAGRFDQLERLTTEKERLQIRLQTETLSKRVMTNLKVKAQRNGRLLEAMQAGLKTASARLTALRALPNELHTYDAGGARVLLDEGQKKRLPK